MLLGQPQALASAEGHLKLVAGLLEVVFEDVLQVDLVLNDQDVPERCHAVFAIHRGSPTVRIVPEAAPSR
jgi:hypothetical protein